MGGDPDLTGVSLDGNSTFTSCQRSSQSGDSSDLSSFPFSSCPFSVAFMYTFIYPFIHWRFRNAYYVPDMALCAGITKTDEKWPCPHTVYSLMAPNIYMKQYGISSRVNIWLTEHRGGNLHVSAARLASSWKPAQRLTTSALPSETLSSLLRPPNFCRQIIPSWDSKKG